MFEVRQASTGMCFAINAETREVISELKMLGEDSMRRNNKLIGVYCSDWLAITVCDGANHAIEHILNREI